MKRRKRKKRKAQEEKIQSGVGDLHCITCKRMISYKGEAIIDGFLITISPMFHIDEVIKTAICLECRGETNKQLLNADQKETGK